MKFPLPSIRHDQESFEVLAQLHAHTKECLFEEIEIDMKEANWFDADMCAAFGGILYSLGEDLNTVNLVNLQTKVERILSKNGFLSHYGRMKISDHWGTTISYQRFDIKDERYFSGYIEDEFIQRSEIPKMSQRLLKKFRESIFEIFGNAASHSHTKLGVFSCGQFFPQRNQLDFTVADLGVGICQNVRDHLGEDLSPEAAIDWATKGNNTTRRNSIPGGLGLKLLCEFIDLNGGNVKIVSDAGYWCRHNQETTTARLRNPFPGTVVSVEINTADQHSYEFAPKPSAKDIF